MEERSNPGGLVINISPMQEPSHTVRSLPSGLGEPVELIQASPQRGSSATTTTAAPCLLCPALGSLSPGESKVMPPKVTPSSLVHSAIHRINAATTSSLARRSFNAVDLSV